MEGSLWDLIVIFFKTGALTFGGGYAMVPLLSAELVPTYLNGPEMQTMIALAQMTPGPVGLNTATFVGYQQFSFLGAFLCTFVLAIPGFVASTLVSCFKEAFQSSKAVVWTLSGIRPLVVGLIAAVVFFFADGSILSCPIANLWRSGGSTLEVSWRGLLIFAVVCVMEWKWKPSVLVTLSVSGILGFLLFGFVC